MKHASKRFLSILLSLVLVLGLIPAMSLNALADSAGAYNDYLITQSQTFVMPAMDVVVNVTFRPLG